jgi:SsrA-binding protein
MGHDRKTDEIRPVASNRKAHHELEVDDTLEAGIQLTGSEVKVLRSGRCVLQGAHVRVVGGEAMLFGLQIPEYPWAHHFGHEPDRPRRLLLHKREIAKLATALRQKGCTCLASRVYFRGARVKIELLVGTGKKLHDKRDSLKERDAKREMARAKR